MSGRHRALTRRPWWQVALSPRRRGLILSSGPRDRTPSTSAVVLLAVSGAAGVLAASTISGPSGTALMLASSLAPSVVLAGMLLRSRSTLSHETWQRHRLEGELAESDVQVSRLAERSLLLTEQRIDDAIAFQDTRRQLRRSRLELDSLRMAIAGARDHEEPTAAPVRLEGTRAFATVDMRVFEAFIEADMADEDAMLDAPVRRGRHVAEVSLEPTQTGSRVVETAGVRAVA